MQIWAFLGGPQIHLPHLPHEQAVILPHIGGNNFPRHKITFQTQFLQTPSTEHYGTDAGNVLLAFTSGKRKRTTLSLPGV